VTRNAAFRLLALLLTTLLFGSVFGGSDIDIGSGFIVWGWSTVLLGNVFVARWGVRQPGRRYPSGGDL
jgi:hypothetical protein